MSSERAIQDVPGEKGERRVVERLCVSKGKKARAEKGSS